MRVDILTCLGQALESPLASGLLGRSRSMGIFQVHMHNLRDYTHDKHKKIDHYAYGGGAGMVLRIEPIANCIRHLQSQRCYEEIIYLAPDGKVLDQPLANQLSLKKNLIVLCGHYKGIDERIRTHFITQEISIGNYVLSAGELAAAVLLDAVVRLLPGAMTDATSALEDSFQEGLVAPPLYTRPASFEGLEVPPVLRSGHAERIAHWRYAQAVERTKARRPAWHEKYTADIEKST